MWIRQYLVIEGWIPNYALEESIAEFKSKPYVMIFTVGADPLTGVNIEHGDSVADRSCQTPQVAGHEPGRGDGGPGAHKISQSHVSNPRLP